MENSKTYQYRKVMKPMLERKRRARINKCLDNLKDLMIECLTQEGEHIVRLEKADILELTVDYLKKQQQHKQHQQHNLETESMDSFRSGYIYAANEVSKTLASIPGVDISLGTTLMSHLGHRLNQVQPLITATLLQQQQQKRQQSNLMNPLKIDLESTATTNRTEQTVASMHSSRTSDTMSYYSSRLQTPISAQISPASSGYHSDLPSPVSSESSFYDPRINNVNISINNSSSSINNRNSSSSSCEDMKTVCWRPW